jgi:DNA polymerase III epsilon subunit-like protein
MRVIFPYLLKTTTWRIKVKNIAIVDIETSGFQNEGGLIVEVGIVGLNLETGIVTNEFNAIVKEDSFGEKHSKSPYGWVFQNSDLVYDDVLCANNLTTNPKIYSFSNAIKQSFINAVNDKFLFFFNQCRAIFLPQITSI